LPFLINTACQTGVKFETRLSATLTKITVKVVQYLSKTDRPLVEGSHSTPEALVKSKNAAVQQLQSLVINPAGDAGEGVVSITSIPKMMR